jgi:antitoxin (DNA-binding transcriptional repressor) of toxin-antitoxin stability system
VPTATVQQAEAELSELIEAALRGEEVIIARDGVLTPVTAARPRRRREPGRFEGQIEELDPDWWKPDDELARLFEEGDPASPGRS